MKYSDPKQTPGAKLGGIPNQAALQALSASPDAQRIMALLQEKGGYALQEAAQAAMQGNTTQFKQILQDVTQTPEGAAAAENLRKAMED